MRVAFGLISLTTRIRCKNKKYMSSMGIRAPFIQISLNKTPRDATATLLIIIPTGLVRLNLMRHASSALNNLKTKNAFSGSIILFNNNNNENKKLILFILQLRIHKSARNCNKS